MRKSTLFSLLTMFLLFIGSNVWADTYTHAFVNTDIPEGTTETNFTLSDVDWTLTLVGGPVSVWSNDLGVHFGTNKATCDSVALSTDGIPGTISSVTVEASRGKNVAGDLTVVVGETAFACGEAMSASLVTTNDAYEFTGQAAGEIAIIWKKNSGAGAFYIKKITVEYSDGGVIVAKPVITPNGGTFTEPQTVTLTAEADAIFYTLDGTDPTTESTQYTEPFTVDKTCTVKAVAYDVTGAHSGIAEAVFNFATVTAINSIAELCAAAPDDPKVTVPVLVQFNNWICTGVKGTSNAYFTDGTNGILLYEKNNGFEVGDQLSGTAQINLTIYKECPEITGLSASTEGVTITKGATLTPMEIAIADLQKNMQGNVVVLKNVTYNAESSSLVDADDNSIIPYGTFMTLPQLEDGVAYDVTGIPVWFVPNNGTGYWEIAPRTADDIQLAGNVVVVARPVITPDGGTFTEPQTVTITAAEGCIIYYTTDGTEPGATPVATAFNGTQYTEPFTIDSDCTVKAIAYDVTGAPSAIAEAEFKFLSLTAIETIADLCDAATEDDVDVLVNFNGWIVTGVKGKNVYFTDGSNGVQLYQDQHNFELGDKITGSAVITLTTYNECAEIIGLTKDTEGISIEKGQAATPMKLAIADLENNMQGCVISLEGVTYNETDNVFIDEDDNTIVPYNAFTKLPELMDGKTYNATGVAIWFAKDAVWEIAPRTADEFELITNQKTPTSSWSVEEEIVDINGTPTATFTTDSNGEVTYESSDESVAVIDENGVITPMGRGITTITAFVAETDEWLPDSKSFTLTVTKDGYAEATFAYNDEDIAGQGAQDVGAELTATRDDIVTLYANRAYAKLNDTHIKVYGTSEKEGVSYLQLSVVEGYAITKIVMTVTGKGYLGIWRDQFDNELDIELPDSVKVTWSGVQNNVVLTNWAGKQARVKYIDVTFVKLNDTGMTVTIGESGIATFCYGAHAIASKDGEWAVPGAVTGFGGNDGTILNVDTLASVIPAKEGLLLMGTPGEYKVYSHPDIEGSLPGDNLLSGVLEDFQAPVGSYVMDEENPVPCFNIVEEGDDVIVKANHAYLLNGSGTTVIPAFFFNEKDYETGISVTSAASEPAYIYNVAGQRMSKMQKGINIVDGKKIAVK